MVLTLHCHVGGGSGGLTQAVARATGVFPSILGFDLSDDEGAVDENTDSALQVAVRGESREEGQRTKCPRKGEREGVKITVSRVESRGRQL